MNNNPQKTRIYSFSKNDFVEASLLNRNNLATNNWVKGPLIVKENTSITVIDIGQKVMSNEYGLMVIKKDNEK